jgi:hypothetical protein
VNVVGSGANLLSISKRVALLSKGIYGDGRCERRTRYGGQGDADQRKRGSECSCAVGRRAEKKTERVFFRRLQTRRTTKSTVRSEPRMTATAFKTDSSAYVTFLFLPSPCQKRRLPSVISQNSAVFVLFPAPYPPHSYLFSSKEAQASLGSEQKDQGQMESRETKASSARYSSGRSP